MDSGALSFRIGSVPVAIRPSVVVMLALIGLLIDSTSIARIVVWTVIGLASILIHEMGHAWVALALGGRPTVQLMGLGGATDPGLGVRPSRLKSAALSLAGPGAGLVVGAVVWLITDPDLDALRSERGIGAFALATVLWMNIGWSVLNLLPVLPLDGGRLLTEALPGDPLTRSRRAYLASAVLGMAVAVALLSVNEPFAGILFGFLATQSFSVWRSLRHRNQQEVRAATLRELQDRLHAGDSAAEAELRRQVDHPQNGPLARTMLIDHLARTGRADDAEEFTRELSDSTPTAVYLVEVMRSKGERGVESLVEAFRRSPSPVAAQHLVLGLQAAGREHDIVDAVEAAARTQPTGGVVETAQHAAHETGAYGVSAELGSLVYQLRPDASGLAAFNVACSLARAGTEQAAIDWLTAAVDRGLPDPTMLDTDGDLASLRPRSDFTDLRRRAFGI